MVTTKGRSVIYDRPVPAAPMKRRGILAGWALCLALLLSGVGSTSQARDGDEGPLRFMPNVRVNDLSSPYPFQVEPSLALDAQGRLFVGWKEASTATGSGQRVSFARSLDHGNTWSANILMNRLGTGLGQSDPWLAVDERGRLYYARLEYSPDFRQNGVVVSRSDDGGVTWGPIVNVDDQPGAADKDSMVSDGRGNLYLAYDDVGPTNTSIRFTRSTDGAVSWSPTVPVNDQRGNVLGPVIAATPGGRVSVVWWDVGRGSIMADSSSDGGLTWGTDVRVNDIPGSTRPNPLSPWGGSLPSVVMDGNGSLFVAWPDRSAGNLDIVVARSDDGGHNWSTPVRVNDDTSGRDQWMPSLVIDGSGFLHATWMDARTGNLNVFYSQSRDRGRTWTTNVRVTTAETPSRYVRPGDYLGLAAGSEGSVYTAWTDGRGADLDIYFARTLRLPGDDPPWAAFTLYPATGNVTTIFAVNASGSWDIEDPGPLLKVRWDWENDGQWDTNWSTVKSASHHYPTPGTFTIRLEVMDAAGLTDNTTQIAQIVASTSGPDAGIPLPVWAAASALGATALGVLVVLVWDGRRRLKPPNP